VIVQRAANEKAPALYIITDRKLTGGRPLPDVLAAALQEIRGSEHRVAVQLREKDLGGRALLALARELRSVTSATGAWLFVNERVDVALACGADGVHLGGGALSPSDVGTIAPDLRVAVSTHSRAEVEAAARDPRVDFVVFGPVFPTASKPDSVVQHTGLTGLHGVTGLGVPVLALGGITPANTAACVSAGAAGVACIRSVISNTKSAIAVRQFLSAFASF
jgi:thiamine-phosphate pyrophosphorylase